MRDADGKESPKLSEDGKSATYRTGLTALRLDEAGNVIGSDDSVTLAVRKPVAIKAGIPYSLTGRVYLVYVNDRSRLALSVDGAQKLVGFGAVVSSDHRNEDYS